jgi:hypothetical protein
LTVTWPPLSFPHPEVGADEDGIASGGTRGDFVSVDPNDGTLLLTQSSNIVRLHPPTEASFVPDFKVAVRVEDGRGGFDKQSFIVSVTGDKPSEIHGTVLWQIVWHSLALLPRSRVSQNLSGLPVSANMSRRLQTLSTRDFDQPERCDPRSTWALPRQVAFDGAGAGRAKKFDILAGHFCHRFYKPPLCDAGAT